MIVLGITGSVGMGKTTVAGMFAAEGAAVCNADAIVHDLFNADAELKQAIAQRWPQAMQHGKVNRALLGEAVFGDDVAMKALEALIHPRVVAREEEFVEQARHAGIWLVVLDIPLLFETGAEKRLDYVAVASTSAEEQFKRVMARPKMTEEKFHRILARQMPDAEKRVRADFVVETQGGMDDSLRQVREIIATLKKINQEKEHYA